MPQLIDLSHPIVPGMVTDNRLPVPVVRDVWTREQSAERYAPGVSFQIASIEFPQNTGTYLDAPFHRHEGMPGVWDFPLDRVADLPIVVIDARRVLGLGRPAMGPELFEGLNLTGAAALFRTGWDAKWGTSEYSAGGHPYLTQDAAQALVDRGAVLFGVDALNADDPQDLTRPAHTILLKHNIAIVENLTNLDRLPPTGARLHAAPVKAQGLGSFPVRAYALV
ncbi:MAG: cyclase family protein [Phycisphaeraceae bacterium]|nr:cyclase family protein [Phycisphaeraceae bacterium]MCB9848026.1 cyclase family protein [Phycisphaeraceae bacterium]